MIKKIKFLIGAGVMAYEVYDMVKRNKEKKALKDAELEIEKLEKKIALNKSSKFPIRRNHDNGERRRDFRR